MANEKSHNGSENRKLDRRTLLRTTGGALATGIAITGLSGSVQAAECPSPNNGESYWTCDDVENTWDTAYRDIDDREKGQVSLLVGDKDVQYDNCNGCVYYYFDLVGVMEDFVEYQDGSVSPNLGEFGFRWNTSSTVTADPQPVSSSNVQTGASDPDGAASPSDDKEEMFWSFSDVLIGAGTVAFPQYGAAAFLYTVARASGLPGDTDESNNEVRFNNEYNPIKSGSFGYYNMRFQVDSDYCGTVELEAFADMGSYERTVTTKTFDLDRHTSCTSM